VDDANEEPKESILEIQQKIEKWKQLTSNLDSIKEHIFGETCSTPINPKQPLEADSTPEESPEFSTEKNPLEKGDSMFDLEREMESLSRLKLDFEQ
jgi:hypothetical protein